MNTVVKNEKHLNTFNLPKRTSSFTEKEIGLISFIDFKFYQKLLVIFISLSTILIIPENPKELASICETHYSKKICNVL